MIKVSATKFRTHLFDYLDKVANGEIIIIERNNQAVAQIASTTPQDWRDRMTITPVVMLPAEEFIQPLSDLWDDYL